MTEQTLHANTTGPAKQVEEKKISLKKKTFWKVFRYFEHIFAFIGLFVLVYACCFDVTHMVSESMAPTLKGTPTTPQDWVFSEKITYFFRAPRRWELVMFESDAACYVIKRVLAFPKETIRINKKDLLINDQILHKPKSLSFLNYYAYGNLRNPKGFTCKEGYYVMGDHSQDSNDSRFEGPIRKKQIYARPLFIFWPLSRIRWVNP